MPLNNYISFIYLFTVNPRVPSHTSVQGDKYFMRSMIRIFSQQKLQYYAKNIRFSLGGCACDCARNSIVFYRP